MYPVEPVFADTPGAPVYPVYPVGPWTPPISCQPVIFGGFTIIATHKLFPTIYVSPIAATTGNKAIFATAPLIISVPGLTDPIVDPAGNWILSPDDVIDAEPIKIVPGATWRSFHRNDDEPSEYVSVTLGKIFELTVPEKLPVGPVGPVAPVLVDEPADPVGPV